MWTADLNVLQTANVGFTLEPLVDTRAARPHNYSKKPAHGESAPSAYSPPRMQRGPAEAPLKIECFLSNSLP
jgi:hypothetical protein